MLSIITPVYNGERFIESCIKVIIDQSCPNVEHIILDGGSTDKTVEIIRCYADKYSHIKWLSEKDQGQSDAMNKGIAMAKGEILGILNVDDFYEPNVLNRILELFKTLPEPSLLVGNCNVLNDDDKIEYVNKPDKLKITDLLLAHPHPYNPSAYFYHKSLHQHIGLYDVDEHYLMDLDFILKAVQKATVKYINETWGNYREIEGTKTVLSKQSGQNSQKAKSLLENHKKKLSLIQRCYLDGKSIYRSKIKYNLSRIKRSLKTIKA